MIQWLTFLSIVVFLAIVTVLFIAKRKEKKSLNKNPFDFGKPKRSQSVRFNQIAQQSYNKAIRIPVVGKGIERIRARLETLAIYDEYTIRREVMRIAYTIVAFIVSITLIVLLIRPSWLVIFWILLGLIFTTGIILDVFVYRVEVRLLNQLKVFNNRVRFYYQQTKMVDEAVYDALQQVGPEMKVQADQIYKILTSTEPEKELAIYEDVAPSRFLKIIAGLSVLVKDQGDVINDRGSAFLRGLSAVNQELNTEILYRSKLQYAMRGISVLALLPVFFALPLQIWSNKYFPIMQKFYESRIGFLAEVLVYTVSLVSYLLIRKMRENNEATYRAKEKRFKWEEWILTHVPFAKPVVRAFTPAPFTKEHFKTAELLKDTNSPLKMEWLTIHRIVLAVAAFFILLGGFFFAHDREADSILYSVLPISMFAGSMSEDEIAEFQQLTKFDREVIADITEMAIVTPESLREHIAEKMGVEEPTDRKVQQTMERIVVKWQALQNAYVKWWEVLFALCFAVATYFLPLWTLYFQRYLRRKDMENEVHQHLILISILRDFERMSVYTILEWMERFSVVFRTPISTAIAVYDSGPEEALDQLTDSVTFEPFQHVVERLKLSLVRVSLQEAFDDIDIEREYLMEQRKEANSRSILEKSNWAELLGMLPIVVLTFLYLVGPLIYLSVVESQDMLTKIQ